MTASIDGVRYDDRVRVALGRYVVFMLQLLYKSITAFAVGLKLNAATVTLREQYPKSKELEIRKCGIQAPSRMRT